jgi:hypothetical protein
MSSVFLSHSHKDKVFVRRLAKDLRRNGHVVWIDEAEINIGDSLVEKIREGIDRVDFVGAVISKASVKSQWVSRELDVATNRELRGKRVLLLPIVIEKIPLPGFLEARLFADFRDRTNYKQGLTSLLRSLGGRKRKPSVSAGVRRELGALRRELDKHNRDLVRRTALLRLRRSKGVQAEIDAQNAEHPEWAEINNAYAFEVMGTPVTVGYLLYSIHKEQRKGGSLLAFALELED